MKLGFIGCGNMAAAMMGGIIKSGISSAGEIVGYDVSQDARANIQKAYGIQIAADSKETAEHADILFLTVKPQFYEAVIHEIKDYVKDGQTIVTVAPGKTLAWLGGRFGKPLPIIRTMPNTPAMVGEGMTAVCPNRYVTDEMLERVCAVLRAFGKAEILPENLMDAFVAVSGSSPAYVFLFIEAMADAVVSQGIPRKQAYLFAAQAVLGSAKMVLETGKHPAELKDMVCSPGGTTIEAVKTLEREGLRNAVIQAMRDCADKAKQL